LLRFGRRFFPERRYRLPLRYVVWGAMVVLALVVVLFIKAFSR
jgi:hypothetical protein